MYGHSHNGADPESTGVVCNPAPWSLGLSYGGGGTGGLLKAHALCAWVGYPNDNDYTKSIPCNTRRLRCREKGLVLAHQVGYTGGLIFCEAGDCATSPLASNVIPIAAREAMSAAILSAIRSHAQLKGSLKFTALEIAHRASSSGFVRVSYGYLASKTGLSIQTMIAHVKRLEALGILRKQKMWLSARRCAVNLYTLLIRARHTCSTQKTYEKLPEAREGQEKFGTLREDIDRLRRGMRLWTVGSEQYLACLEKVQTLEAIARAAP